MVCTEAEVFILCSIIRRAKGDPTLPCTPESWVAQKWVYPVRFSSPRFSRDLCEFLVHPFFSWSLLYSVAHGRFFAFLSITLSLLNYHSFPHRTHYIVVCFLIRLTDDSHQHRTGQFTPGFICPYPAPPPSPTVSSLLSLPLPPVELRN